MSLSIYVCVPLICHYGWVYWVCVPWCCTETSCSDLRYRCNSGSCILKKNARCDGVTDCSDHSDERDCGESSTGTQPQHNHSFGSSQPQREHIPFMATKLQYKNTQTNDPTLCLNHFNHYHLSTVSISLARPKESPRGFVWAFLWLCVFTMLQLFSGVL